MGFLKVPYRFLISIEYMAPIVLLVILQTLTLLRPTLEETFKVTSQKSQIQKKMLNLKSIVGCLRIAMCVLNLKIVNL